MEIVIGAVIVVASIIHLGRAFYLYKLAQKPISLAEMEAVNQAMRYRDKEDDNGNLVPWWEWNVWDNGKAPYGQEPPIYVWNKLILLHNTGCIIINL